MTKHKSENSSVAGRQLDDDTLDQVVGGAKVVDKEMMSAGGDPSAAPGNKGSKSKGGGKNKKTPFGDILRDPETILRHLPTNPAPPPAPKPEPKGTLV